MGMYSSFDYEEIKVTDAKGLTEFCLNAKNGKEYFGYMYEDFLYGIIDGKQYSFESWGDIKLISYWYDEQVKFLIELSKYIEGYVEFTFETYEEKAKIKFKNGKTIIALGKMKFTDIKAEDFLRNDTKNSL